MNKHSEFIKNAGGCIVSKNILEGNGQLRWCVRENSINPADNGWRFFSDIDTEDYLDDPNNLAVCDYNTVINIEPAVLAIYSLPVGTDIELLIENNKRKFYDSLTGEEIDLSSISKH